MAMKTFVAGLCLSATATLFGQGHTPSLGQEPVTPAARSTDWKSARALNAVFNDKARVKRFLNEVANEGDRNGPTFVESVYEYRVVDLNADGWLELVALVGGGRPTTGLAVVFQTSGGLPPTDRLTSTYEGFGIHELTGFNVPALNDVLRDLDGDGTYEIVMPQYFGRLEGGWRPQAEIPEVFAWKQNDYANVSARYPKFYRDEVLPRLQRQLQMLERLPAAADAFERADQRADRERVASEIAEVKKRARRK
jgi:hypothetical protein